MEVNNNNYFSKEVRSKFMSVSTFKSIAGFPAMQKCEAGGLAKSKKRFEYSKSNSILVGSYVDSYFENTLDEFKLQNSEIFTQKGELRSEFKAANALIEKAKSSSPFISIMEGEKQVILRGDIFGREWIGKVDNLKDEIIVDLKVMADIKDVWCGREYGFVNFIDAWNFPLQGAVYQELERQRTGILKEFVLAVITKEKFPRLEIIHIPNDILNYAMENAEYVKDRVFDVFDEKTDPTMCNNCDYCNSTHVITEVKSYYDFIK